MVWLLAVALDRVPLPPPRWCLQQPLLVMMPASQPFVPLQAPFFFFEWLKCRLGAQAVAPAECVSLISNNLFAYRMHLGAAGVQRCSDA